MTWLMLPREARMSDMSRRVWVVCNYETVVLTTVSSTRALSIRRWLDGRPISSWNSWRKAGHVRCARYRLVPEGGGDE